MEHVEADEITLTAAHPLHRRLVLRAPAIREIMGVEIGNMVVQVHGHLGGNARAPVDDGAEHVEDESLDAPERWVHRLHPFVSSGESMTLSRLPEMRGGAGYRRGSLSYDHPQAPSSQVEFSCAERISMAAATRADGIRSPTVTADIAFCGIGSSNGT